MNASSKNSHICRLRFSRDMDIRICGTDDFHWVSDSPDSQNRFSLPSTALDLISGGILPKRTPHRASESAFLRRRCQFQRISPLEYQFRAIFTRLFQTKLTHQTFPNIPKHFLDINHALMHTAIGFLRIRKKNGKHERTLIVRRSLFRLHGISN